MVDMRLIVGGVALLLAGCAQEGDTMPQPTLGEAVNYNMAVHILPLPPSSAAGSPTDIPGRRSDMLMERYMTGKVKKPTLGTTGDSLKK